MGLPIVEEKPKSKKEQYEEATRAQWENRPPTKIDPLCTVMGRERIHRSIELIENNLAINNSQIIDLGCGVGTLGTLLAEKGANITSVDVAEHREIPGLKKACLPYLKLPENSFDGVIFTDVLAEIDSHLHRLTFSEIAALMKRDGWLMCSTPLDLYSHDACQQFIQLLETEFEIVVAKKSYHRLYFYLIRWVEAPSRFILATHNSDYRLKQLKKRMGLMRLWFYLNSIKPLSFLWYPIKVLLHPLKKFLLNSRSILLMSEHVSELLFGENGLSHIIVLARKKKI